MSVNNGVGVEDVVGVATCSIDPIGWHDASNEHINDKMTAFLIIVIIILLYFADKYTIKVRPAVRPSTDCQPDINDYNNKIT